MNRVLHLIYSLLIVLFIPFLFILVVIHVIIRPKYFRAYLERLSFILPKKSSEKKVIWLHAVSVGEVISCQPLISELKEKNYKVYLSTTTPTGYEVAKRKYSISHIFYFPFDFGILIKRILKRINPQVAILCEMEIWPTFIRVVKKKGIPIYLVSGRLGDVDYKNYKRFRFFFKHVFNNLTGLFMQTKLDEDRVKSLCSNSNVKTLGSLKFDISINQVETNIGSLLPKGFLICAASTHRGEEELILKSFKELKQSNGHLKLILVPRHIHRVKEITSIIEKYNLTYIVRSDNSKRDIDVFIVDTIGELTSIFHLTDLVIMGGSFSKKIGGHNIIEPSFYKKCVICGKHMENFQDIFSMFIREKAVIETSISELTNNLSILIDNTNELNKIGERAYNVVKQNAGSAKRIVNEILKDSLS